MKRAKRVNARVWTGYFEPSDSPGALFAARHVPRVVREFDDGRLPTSVPLIRADPPNCSR